MPAQATGLAALLQKMMPGLSAGADKLFMPGGALGAAAPQQQMPQPMTGPDAMAGAAGQGAAGAAGGGIGQGLASLTQNPAFTMGMGILQGNQRGDPFGGAMQGLQGANLAAIQASDREREEQLRQAMSEYFKSRTGAAGEATTADADSPEMQAANYGTAVGDLANQQRTNMLLQQQGELDPMLRMMMESGMPGASNGYGGINPYLLSMMS